MRAEQHITSRSIPTQSYRGGPVMAESEADKKRNKLGYQRISIACSHCRRRKIRCLVAEDDPQQRCQNCIRLKKECVFYPVDQQSAMEDRSQGSGKAGGSVVSSSPQGSEHGTFQGIPTPVTGTFQGLPVEPGSAMPVQETEYGYRHQELGHGNWSHEGAPGSAGMPPPVSPANSYWRYGPQSASAQPFDYQGRGASSYHAQSSPMHSQSYSHADSPARTQGPYGAQYSHGPPPPPPMSSRYPPSSLDIQGASMLSPSGGSRSAPVGHPQMAYGQNPAYMAHPGQQGAPPPHSAYPPPPPGHAGYQGSGGAWYGHAPGHYPPMEEDPHGYHQGRPS